MSYIFEVEEIQGVSDQIPSRLTKKLSKLAKDLGNTLIPFSAKEVCILSRTSIAVDLSKRYKDTHVLPEIIGKKSIEEALSEKYKDTRVLPEIIRFEFDDRQVKTDVFATIYKKEGLEFCHAAEKRGLIDFGFEEDKEITDNAKSTPNLKWKEKKYSLAARMKILFFEAMKNIGIEITYYGIGLALTKYTIEEIDIFSSANGVFISYCKTKWDGSDYLPILREEMSKKLKSSKLFENVTGFNQKTLSDFYNKNISSEL